MNKIDKIIVKGSTYDIYDLIRDNLLQFKSIEKNTLIESNLQDLSDRLDALDVLLTEIENNLNIPTPIEINKNYLTIERTSTEPVVLQWPKIAHGSDNTKSIQYIRENDTQWTTISGTNVNNIILDDDHNKVYLKGVNSNYYDDNSAYSDYGLGDTAYPNRNKGKFIVYGNILSLFYGDEFESYNEFEDGYCLCNFFGGTNVVDASDLILPSTTTYSCYESMFKDCTELYYAPNLPATILSDNCYSEMFSGCHNLTRVYPLYAAILQPYCYYHMFYYCSSLSTAPKIYATTLANSCCYEMFYNCRSLYFINWIGKITNMNVSGAFTNWCGGDYEDGGDLYYGCDSVGVFINIYDNNFSRSNSGIVDGWTVYNSSSDILIIDPLEKDKNLWIKGIDTTGWNLYKVYAINDIPDDMYPIIGDHNKINEVLWINDTLLISSLQYKINKIDIDNGNGYYSNLAINIDSLNNRLTSNNYVNVNNNFKKVNINIYMYSNNDDGNAKFNVMGNLNNVIKYYIQDAGDYNSNKWRLENNGYAAGLFAHSGVEDASMLKLKSGTLDSTYDKNIYAHMFYNCKQLTKAPILPATSLSESCYDKMFAYCTSLLNTPSTLPATTLAQYCYYSMFYGCYILQTGPEILAYNSAVDCYVWMFCDTSVNYLKVLSDLTSDNGADTWLNNNHSSITGTIVVRSNATHSAGGLDGTGAPINWNLEYA